MGMPQRHDAFSVTARVWALLIWRVLGMLTAVACTTGDDTAVDAVRTGYNLIRSGYNLTAAIWSDY
jgi:hypothetical protein